MFLYAGCSSFVPLLRKLCALTGDEIEVREYKRLLPLVTSEKHLSSYEHLRDGDCVVAFSRKEIHKIKSFVERLHPQFKCYVVYGNLPPEARKEQARLFNFSARPRDSPLTESVQNADHTKGTVLIASDAIGFSPGPESIAIRSKLRLIIFF